MAGTPLRSWSSFYEVRVEALNSANRRTASGRQRYDCPDRFKAARGHYRSVAKGRFGVGCLRGDQGGMHE